MNDDDLNKDYPVPVNPLNIYMPLGNLAVSSCIITFNIRDEY